MSAPIIVVIAGEEVAYRTEDVVWWEPRDGYVVVTLASGEQIKVQDVILPVVADAQG